MSTKDLNNQNLHTINSVDPILNLNNNPKRDSENEEQTEEKKYQKICSKLKDMKYENMFEEKFIEDFMRKDLELFERINKEKKNNEQKESKKENDIFYHEKRNNIIDLDNTDQKETKYKEDSKDIGKLIQKDNEQGDINKKFKKPEIIEINNKFNIIKIYIDLRNLYQENINGNLFNENFTKFVNNIIEYRDRDSLIRKFDILCQRIKGNLFGKKGNFFSNKFFQNIDPIILRFLNRFYMVRLFIAMKNKETKLNKISIINIKNNLSKEIFYNIIIKMINIYKIFINQKNESEPILISSINKGTYTRNKAKIKDEKSLLQIFIGNELEYFNILRDYIYFLKTFIYDEKQLQNDDDNIYNKYMYYYDSLSVFKNNNYSYINEYKWGKIYDEENKKWNKYVKEEYEDEGLEMLFNLLERMDNEKEKGIFTESKTEFYEMIFILLGKKIEQKEINKEKSEEEKKAENKENIKLINLIIKIILSDEENIFKNYLKYEEDNKKGIFKPIIDIIRENLIKIIERKNNDENWHALEQEYLNSLILLLQSFGEYKNKHLLEYIFEKNKKAQKSVFDILIDAYEKIIIDLNDKKEYDDVKKNKLIIFHSITNCIIEYIDLYNYKDKKNHNKLEALKTINDIKNEGKKIDTKIIEENKNQLNQIIDLKMKNIKMKIFRIINKDRNDLIYDIFILENHLQIISSMIKNIKINDLNNESELNYLIKKFQIDNTILKPKILLKESLNMMNKCFKYFLELQKIILNYEKDSMNITEIEYDIKYDEENIEDIGAETINNIKEDVKNLYYRYKTNNLNVFLTLGESGENELVKYQIKKELLVLIFLNYKKIFYLIYSEAFASKEFKYLLYINDNDNNIKSVRNLIDFYFAHSKHRLIVLLSFLQKIHDVVEIKIDNQLFYQLNILKPEYLNISNNSKDYFSDLIDYSLPEAKLMTIYNNIECITYDIKRKKWQQVEDMPLKHIFYPQRNWEIVDKFAINTYKFWEIINLILFICINIYLIIKYKKSRREDELIFNEIDNRQSFLVTKLWPVFHIVFLLFFLLYWIFNRAKLEYFFAMTKYINKYFTEDQKLSMGEKAKLLKKDKSDFYINNFFPEADEVETKSFFKEINIFGKLYNKVSYFYVNYFKVYLYTIKMVYPFILSIICLCLTYWSQIFYIFPVFLFFNLSETLLTIFLLFIEQASTLLLIAIFFIVILYIFSWLGFFFLPKLFIYEAVDRNNELVNLDYTEENICSSTVPCMLYFLNFGFRDSLMEQNLISFKNETGYYFRQFFFNLFLYVFIHLIFDNIFLVTISNAFDDMKKSMIKNDDKKENVCFICNMKRSDCIKDYKDFKKHLEKHNMWKYIRYICKILLKKRYQYTDEEYYVWKQIRDKKLEWFPRSGEKETNDDNEDEEGEEGDE